MFVISRRHPFARVDRESQVVQSVLEEAGSSSLEARKKAALARQGVDFHSRPEGTTELQFVEYLEGLGPGQLREEAGVF